jgi:site-specific DNA-methyltransferase (adenine-specific)
MWEQLKRVTKKNGAIVLFGSQPFTSALVMSNPKMFKYEWVWDKKKAGNIFLAKTQPMKTHEIISVFAQTTPYYKPQMVKRDKIKRSKNYGTGEAIGGNRKKENKVYEYTEKYPITILESSNANQKGKIHPTQKPVALMEYLIKTYTNEGETVLDFTAGSFTTGVACVNLNRKFIGIENDKAYFDIGVNRINEQIKCLDLMKEMPDGIVDNIK